MPESVLPTPPRRWTPQNRARLAAAVMVVEGITSVRGSLRIPNEFVVTNDAALTAANILANETLWRVGVLVALLGVISHIVGLVLFYELFRPVNPTVARLSAYGGIVGIAIQAASVIFQVAPLKILHGGEFSTGLTQDQLAGLAYWALHLQGQTFNMYMVLFGVSIIFLGYLVYRSGFVPRVLGILEMVAGTAYLVLLWPPLATAWHPWYLFFGAGELLLGLWLLIRGVDNARWHAVDAAYRRRLVESQA